MKSAARSASTRPRQTASAVEEGMLRSSASISDGLARSGFAEWCGDVDQAVYRRQSAATALHKARQTSASRATISFHCELSARNVTATPAQAIRQRIVSPPSSTRARHTGREGAFRQSGCPGQVHSGSVPPTALPPYLSQSVTESLLHWHSSPPREEASGVDFGNVAANAGGQLHQPLFPGPSTAHHRLSCPGT